jgi:hypothetical protein
MCSISIFNVNFVLSKTLTICSTHNWIMGKHT